MTISAPQLEDPFPVYIKTQPVPSDEGSPRKELRRCLVPECPEPVPLRCLGTVKPDRLHTTCANNGKHRRKNRRKRLEENIERCGGGLVFLPLWRKRSAARVAGHPRGRPKCPKIMSALEKVCSGPDSTINLRTRHGRVRQTSPGLLGQALKVGLLF